MSVSCPFIGSGGGVAVEHLAASPSGQSHEVAFVAAIGQPGMGEAVAQLVGVDLTEPGLLAPPPDHL
jgi:hypothetical protein